MISRRSFLKTGAAATMAPAIVSFSPSAASAAPSPLNKWPGRVAINYNNTHTATQYSGTAGDKSTLMKMVDDAVKMLTGETTVGAAWKAIFPASLTAGSKIAIKINVLNSGVVPPHPFIVSGIIEGLMLMDIGGSTLSRGNITIYDANNNGNYFSSFGYTAANFPGVVLVPQDTLAAHGSHHDYANTIFNANFLINVPGIRGTTNSANGYATLGYKSHLGTFPAQSHGHTYPLTHLPQYLGEGPVFDKQVLTVCNAIYGTRYQTGPSTAGVADNYNNYAKALMDPNVPAGRINIDTLMMSTDPVSIEYQMHKVMRYYYATPQSVTVSSMPDYLKLSAGIAVGTNPVYNIGVLREDMRVGRIINGVSQGWTGTEGWVNAESAAAIGLHPKIAITPNPVNSTAYFNFWAPEYLAGKKAALEIYSAQGRLVYEGRVPVAGLWNQAVWNGCSRSGRPVAAGRYAAYVKVGREVLHSAFTMVR